VSDGGEESRRYPRLLARCRVHLRDRFGMWEAETEDVGPRGCRIVTLRPQTVGTLVRLTVESDWITSPLDVAGQVVWTRADRPSRAGIRFAGGASAPGALAPAAWFDALAASLPAAEAVRLASAALEIAIEVDEPVAEPEPLTARLMRRAEELLVAGDPGAAELIFRRAAALSPVDDEAALAAARAR